MTSHRFYCAEPLSVGVRLDLPENAARHACRVLRLRVGDDLVLFDGCGGEYFCRIAETGRDRVAVDVCEWHDVERESALSLILVQALQAGEKMDMTVQKAVELGISGIVPVASRRSVVRLAGERAERRVGHWRNIVVAACEQCGRNRLPVVSELCNLEQWLSRPVSRTVVRLMLDPYSSRTLDALPLPVPAGCIELLIGAEGGLTEEEMQLAESAGFVSVRLGPRVLRTETAGLAALAAIQCLWGDFRERRDHV